MPTKIKIKYNKNTRKKRSLLLAHYISLSLSLDSNLINYYHAHFQLMFDARSHSSNKPDIVCERELKWERGTSVATTTRQISNSNARMCTAIERAHTRSQPAGLIYDTAIFFWKFITKYIFNQHNVLNELSIRAFRLFSFISTWQQIVCERALAHIEIRDRNREREIEFRCGTGHGTLIFQIERSKRDRAKAKKIMNY